MASLFGAELRECCASGGKVSGLLHTPFRLLSAMWKATTQEVEGIMNLLQVNVAASPGIGQPLLDARVGIRKSLKLPEKAGSTLATKWSAIADDVDALVTEAGTSLCAIEDIMVPARFFAPRESRLRIANVQHPSDPHAATMLCGAKLSWAKYANAQWRKLSGFGALSAMALPAVDGAAVWHCAFVFRLTGYFVQLQPAQVQPAKDAEGSEAIEELFAGQLPPASSLGIQAGTLWEVVRPLKHVSSLQLLADCHERCVVEKSMVVEFWSIAFDGQYGSGRGRLSGDGRAELCGAQTEAAEPAVLRLTDKVPTATNKSSSSSGPLAAASGSAGSPEPGLLAIDDGAIDDGAVPLDELLEDGESPSTVRDRQPLA